MPCLLRLTWPSRSLWVGVWQTSSTPLYFSYLLDIQISVVFHCVEHLATATAIKTLVGRCVGKASSRVRFDLYDNHVFNIFTGGSVTLFSWPIKLIRRKYYNKVNSSKCRIKVKPHSKIWIENAAATSNKDKENNNVTEAAHLGQDNHVLHSLNVEDTSFVAKFAKKYTTTQKQLLTFLFETLKNCIGGVLYEGTQVHFLFTWTWSSSIVNFPCFIDEEFDVSSDVVLARVLFYFLPDFKN